MLLRQKPNNIEMYIKVNSEKNKELQKSGYCPSYLYEGFYYYLKNSLRKEDVD